MTLKGSASGWEEQLRWATFPDFALSLGPGGFDAWLEAKPSRKQAWPGPARQELEAEMERIRGLGFPGGRPGNWARPQGK